MRQILRNVLLMIIALFANDLEGAEYAGRGGAGAYNSVYRVQCWVFAKNTNTSEWIDFGTAFGHKSGYAISANHVVDECAHKGLPIRLVASDGTDSSATVTNQNPSLDLALLKPNEGFIRKPIAISTSDEMAIGSQVTSWGFPSGYKERTPLLVVGYLAGVSQDRIDSSIKRWVINAAVNKGNSGGPLMETETASVIGVVIQKYSPLSKELNQQLVQLSKSDNVEAKILAQGMIDIADRSQLVIGLAVIAADLRTFLRQANVEP